MLILMRRKNEAVIIADNEGNIIARVRVTKLASGQTHLGFEADKNIMIHREEIYDKEMAKR